MQSKKVKVAIGLLGAFVTGAVVATAVWEGVAMKIGYTLYKAGCDTADDMGFYS